MKRLRPKCVWLVTATIGLSACAPQAVQDTAPKSDSTTAATTTVAAATSEWPPSGPVEAGTYHIPSSAWNVAGFTLTMPEGWEIDPAIPPGAAKNADSDAEAGFYPVMVDAIYSDPCVGSAGGPNDLIQVGPSVDDLVQALLDQPHTVATSPVETTVGGLTAKRIDLTMADDPETATCNVNLPGHLQIWHSPPVDKYFVLLGDGTASVYIVDVNGERQVFLTQHLVGTPADDVEQMQAIIDSVILDAATTMSVPESTVDTLPDLGLPGMNLDEPAGEYGWTGATGARGWMHRVIEDPPGVTRQTQIAFAVDDDCFASQPVAEPIEVNVAGLDGLYLEPYEGYDGYWSTSHPGGGERIGAYALPIGDQTLCVYLRWETATTPEELRAARGVVDSIRGVPFEKDGIRINFTLPFGWDTG